MTTLESPPAPAETATPTPPQRSRWYDSLLLTVLSVILALFIGGLMIVFSDDQVRTDLGFFFTSPGSFFSDAWYTFRDAYIALFEGAIFDPNHTATASEAFGPIMGTIYTATPLILSGLAVAIAFRAGLFNIGANGQVIVGAFCSGYVGFILKMPPLIHVVLAIAAGIAGGAAWGFIAGFLKARAGAHEVITTIMLNYVALYGLLYLIGRSSIVAPDNPQTSKPIYGTARLPHLFGADLRVDLGIILAIAAAAWVSWTLTRSKLGFRMRAAGANAAAARTAGMSVGAITIISMSVAGGLAGLAGTTLALGGATSYVVTPNIASNIGFDGITVALLGRSKPWGVVAAGLLFGALKQGGAQMQATPSVQAPIDIITVIQALIVIFIAAPALVKGIFRFKRLGNNSLAPASTNLAVYVESNRVPRIPRNVSAGAFMIVLGALSLWGFAFSSRATGKATYETSLGSSWFKIHTLTFTARPVLIVLGVLVIAAGAARITQVVAARWCAAVAIVGLVLSLVVWSVAGSQSGMNIVSLLQGTLFPAAIPLILGALAGVIGERSGVVNVAIEGQLLLGAFVTALIATVTASIWIGVAAGMISGLILAWVLSVLAIRYFVDQVIIGVVLNVFALGLTSFLFNKLLSPHATQFNQPGYFKIYKIPVLGEIPIIGAVLFQGTIFLYVTYVLIIVVQYALFNTKWGLRVRSVGEHPRAADTVGINVPRTRYRAVLLAGLFAGLGGAFLVIGSGAPGTFSLNMSNGKGFIALAAVIFGRWTPRGAVAACLLFGFFDQLQSLLAQAGSPIDPNLLLMMPYLATIFAVAGFVGRVRPPAADGQPYVVG
jgi:ABC-type uncharacterized transport system permease subunit